MKHVTTAEILARKALERPCGEECVAWAIELIEAGHNSKSLYVLAGLSGPLNHFEIADMRDRVLEELDVPEKVKADPISTYVGELVQASLIGGRPLRAVFAEITQLAIELGYPSELQPFYNLHFAAEDLSHSEDQWYWTGPRERTSTASCGNRPRVSSVFGAPNSALHRTWSRNLLRPKCGTIRRAAPGR